MKTIPQLTKKNLDGQFNSMVKFTPATDEELANLQKDGVGGVPDGYVAGWASTPDMDLYGHVIETGAFDDSIAKRGLRGPKSIKLLIGHDWRQIGGVITVLKTVGQKLWIEAQLNLALSFAKDALEQCRMLGGLNFSVGFNLEEYAWVETKTEEYLKIMKGDLIEVSIVPFPGNEEATMEYVKSAEAMATGSLITLSDFEKHLVSQGLVKSRNEAKAITQAVKANLCVFGIKSAGDDPPDDVLAVDPGLDAAQLQELHQLAAQMKAILVQQHS